MLARIGSKEMTTPGRTIAAIAVTKLPARTKPRNVLVPPMAKEGATGAIRTAEGATYVAATHNRILSGKDLRRDRMRGLSERRTVWLT